MIRITTVTITIFMIHYGFALSSFHISRDVTNTSKAGLAWPNGNEVELEQYQTTGKVAWYYTWSPFSVETNLEFVPMLWGPKSVDQFSSTINDSITERDVKAVLGMNEPQEPGQSNLTPEQGAEMWKAYLEPLRGRGVRLGSPAPSSAPSGKIWLQDFLTACGGGCTVDFIALHVYHTSLYRRNPNSSFAPKDYYDVNATQFKEYLTDYHQTFQRQLWVTEWACQNFNDVKAQCSQDHIVLFLKETQTFMDNSDFVERYAWFGAMKDMSGVNPADSLMDSGGNINALGKQYIGSEPPQTSGGGNADGPKVPKSGGGGGVSISSSRSNCISLRILFIIPLLALLVT